MKKRGNSKAIQVADKKSNRSDSSEYSKDSVKRPNRKHPKNTRIRGVDGFENIKDYFTTPGNPKLFEAGLTSLKSKQGPMSSRMRLDDQNSQKNSNKSIRRHLIRKVRSDQKERNHERPKRLNNASDQCPRIRTRKSTLFGFHPREPKTHQPSKLIRPVATLSAKEHAEQL